VSALLSIGEVAAAAGVKTGTIRYYEQMGLVPNAARTPAGYRQYPPDVVHRLKVIRNAQRFGFALRDIADFFRVRAAGGKPCERVRAAAERMVTAVDVEISELIARRQQMLDTLQLWDRLLEQAPGGSRAYLLEALGESVRARRRRAPSRGSR